MLPRFHGQDGLLLIPIIPQPWCQSWNGAIHFFHYLLYKIGSRFSHCASNFSNSLVQRVKAYADCLQLNEKERKVMIFMSWKLWELLIWWASWNSKFFHALGVHYVRSVFPCSRLSFSVGMLLNKSRTGAKIFMHLFLFYYIETVTATTVLPSCVKGLTSACNPSFKSPVLLTVCLFFVSVDLLPLQWIQREY